MRTGLTSRLAALSLGLIVAGCGGTASTPDTDCESPDSAEDRVRFASIVLLGTITEWDGAEARLQIDEIWRGPDLPGEVVLIPEAGRTYTAGVRYLVFPTSSPSPLNDARCSATTRWRDELLALRPENARAPGSAPGQDADLPWEWVIAAAVGYAAFAGVRTIVTRRRHPTAAWNPDHTLEDEDAAASESRQP